MQNFAEWECKLLYRKSPSILTFDLIHTHTHCPVRNVVGVVSAAEEAELYLLIPSRFITTCGLAPQHTHTHTHTHRSVRSEVKPSVLYLLQRKHGLNLFLVSSHPVALHRKHMHAYCSVRTEAISKTSSFLQNLMAVCTSSMHFFWVCGFGFQL